MAVWIQRGGRFGVATVLMVSLATVVPEVGNAAAATTSPAAAAQVPSAETVAIKGMRGAEDLPDAQPLPEQVDDLPEGAAEVDPSAAWRAVPGTPIAVRDTTRVAVPGDEPGDPAVVEPVPVDEQAGSAPAVEVAVEPADDSSTPSLLVTISPDQGTVTQAPSDELSSSEPTPTQGPSQDATPSGGRVRADDPEPSEQPTPTADPAATDEPTPADAPSSAEDTTTSVQVRLSYADFRHAYAADWGARLGVLAYPECFLTTPLEEGCSEGIEVPSVNDPIAETVTFVTGDLTTPLVTPDVVGSAADSEPGSWDFSESLTGGRAFGRSAPSLAPMAGGSGGTVYALAAAAGGSTGNYAAVPLQPAGSWQVGEGSGEFSYSYPFELPKPAVAGPTPELSLAYSSGSVDGMTKAQNGQASMAGIGWELTTGYIVRSYKPCREDGWTTKGDLCWLWDSANGTTFNDLSIVLNGRSSRLIRIGLGNSYRLQDDPGWQVTRVWKAQGDVTSSDPDNSDNDNEAFKVQTPDGTTYWFGWGRGSEATWTVPVYGNNAGEPCSSASANANKFCMQAWRWNLDRVVDSHGNLITYEYARETNYYSRYGSVSNLQVYDRGGYLSYIRYGQGVANNYSDVFVETKQRCVAVVNNPSAACPNNPRQEPSEWPDVPADQICYSSDTACLNGSPSFFSLRRYEAVHTRRYYTDNQGAKHTIPVDTYRFNFNFPIPPGGDGDSLRDLWLAAIQRTGHSAPAVTLPSVIFTGDFKRNRVVADDGQYSFQKMRIVEVQTETGGTVDVVYGHDDTRGCDAAYVSNLPRSQSTKECFPAQYNDDWEWFHKFTVQRIALGDPRLGISYAAPHGNTAQNNLGRLRVFDYDYWNAPAWRFRNNPSVKTANETWDDWRGYNTVLINTRKVGPDQVPDGGDASHSRRKVVVYQGMDQTKKNNAVPTQLHENVQIADSDGTLHLDSVWLAGKVIEDSTHKVSEQSGNWAPATQTFNEWAQYKTADFDFGRPGRFVYLQSSTVLPRVGSPRRTTTYTVNDGGSNHRGVMLGAPTTTVDDMGTATTNDDLATCTYWIWNNATALRLPRLNTSWTQGCGEGALISKAESYYDGHTSLTADPTEGELRQSVSYATGSKTIRVQHAYDGYGRRIRSSVPYEIDGSAYDGSALTSRAYEETTYNPGWNVDKTIRSIRTTAAKNADTTEMSTTTTLEDARSAPVTIVDPNGETTSVSYDGIGRVLTVDKPGVPAGAHSVAYAYSMPALTGGPSRITTQVLRDSGVSDVSYAYFDGWGRQIQSQVLRPAPTGGAPDGRIVSYTGYDDRGLPWLSAAAVPVDGVAASAAVPVTVAGMRHYTTTAFDALGRPTDVVDYTNGLENFTTTTTYGSGFDKVAVIPEGAAQAQQTTVTTLDAVGRAASVSQYANGHSADPSKDDGYAEYQYDAAGRLAEIKTPTQRDSNGDPTAWATYSYVYDLLGRRTKATDADTGVTDYTYDAFGNVLTQKQPALLDTHGYVTNTYDPIGRLTKREHVDDGNTSTLATWAYGTSTSANTLGRLTKVTSESVAEDGGTTHEWSFSTSTPGYDGRGNPTSTTVTYPAEITGETPDVSGGDSVSKTTSFTYNHADAPKTVAIPEIPGTSGAAALPATTLTYSYGRNGLFESVVDGSRTLGAASYDTLGRPLGLWSGIDANDPDRMNRSFTWFVRDLVKTQAVAVGPSSSEATQLSFAYDYDSMGTPVRVTGTRPGSEAAWCYGYDGINRLIRARTGVPVEESKDCSAAGDGVVSPVTGVNYDLSYGFDQARLKTVKSGASGPEVTYAYGAGTHPHAATELSEPAHATAPGLPSQGALAYDAGGRAETWTPHGGSVVNYTYDVQGNLVSSEDTATGGMSSVYAYDADGMRLVRKTGDQVVLYLGDTEITTTTDGTTTTRSSRRVYTAPGGTPLAVQETNGSAVDWTYVFGDGQDSIRYSRNNQTDAGSYFFYTPYGDPIGDPTLPGGRGFLNKAHDPDGTVRLDHRPYDGGLNVFATPDPLLVPGDPLSLNPYTYASNNPVGMADPTGLRPSCVDGVGGTCGYDLATGTVTDYKPETQSLPEDYENWMDGAAESKAEYEQAVSYAIRTRGYNQDQALVGRARSVVDAWDAEHSDGPGLLGALDAIFGVSDTFNSCGGNGFHGGACAFNGITSLPTPLKFGRVLRVLDNVGDAANSVDDLGRVLSHTDLNPAQLSNFTRYTKKLPAGAESTIITRGADGAVQLSTKVPGRVPGSYATYDKVVDASGTTIGYTKTTVAPDGTIVHIKDKLLP